MLNRSASSCRTAHGTTGVGWGLAVCVGVCGGGVGGWLPKRWPPKRLERLGGHFLVARG